jgi:hypothetical protein
MRASLALLRVLCMCLRIVFVSAIQYLLSQFFDAHQRFEGFDVRFA